MCVRGPRPAYIHPGQEAALGHRHASVPSYGAYATTWQADPDRVYATGISNNIMEIGISSWHERLACKAGPAVKVKDNTRTPAKCRDQSEFLTYRLPDMGHNWPGSKDPGMGDPVTGVNATDLIWEFFKVHPRKSF
ncbi:hypothetical protein ACH492_29470 [Streptomyces sp. NPDC019443]|uniref:hypothetical protein n=1 Tax=Streptomyces sp. NPDC019443 TaxID=3365061 RepID=UPI00378B07A4